MIRHVRWNRLWVAALVFLFFAPTDPLGANPPSRRRGGVQTIRPPETAPPPAGNTGNRGEFDWQAVVGGVIGSMMDRPTRPSPGRRPGGRRPGRQPGWQPAATPPGQPWYPEHPDAVPGDAVPLPPNALEPTPAAPQPNPVIAEVPPQPSPLRDRVWEVSIRESRCYSKELSQLINGSLDATLSDLKKAGHDMKRLDGSIEPLRQLLKRNASWRELEPIMRRLLDQNRSTFSGSAMEQFEHLVRLMLLRDALQVVAKSAPRGRSGPLGITVIPTGLIWIILDPTLAIGTGLIVTDRIMICGGGHGELEIVHISCAEALGLPVGPGDPVPDIAEEDARQSKGMIFISNSKDAATAVNYVLNRRSPYSIQPGYIQELTADQDWVIEFDRGGGQGAARYSLTEGYYEFRIVENQWELVKRTFDITIDNRQGKQDFRYLKDNEVVTVKAGEVKEHSSSQPVVIAFDRGEGTDNPARKNLNKNGTYKVAVDTRTNYLDLFATKDGA